ncbi:MAG: molecular chaperone HtpG [Calditrichaeota bacterium]|nr:MAG: molecular chaperone HtpG [Calditrichota bacterium]
MAATTKQSRVEEFQFQAEMEQLLHLIVHALYTHREIFLRELISNASDALNKIRFRMLTDKNVLDPDADLKITIEVDPKEGHFAIEDTGIGMTRDELIREIGTVARSGTLEFLKQLQQQKGAVDASLIGQFGVGFYSVFMVADEVTIETRHADPDSKAYRWRSRGTGTFTIEEIDRPNRGTRISFKLKEDAREFSDPERVKQIIKRYSNFVDFPIYLGKEQVNRVTALWQLPKGEIKEEELVEFYKFIANDFNPPLAHLHLSLEGAVSFKALLFIPETAPPVFLRDDLEKSVHLYSRKVLIQEHSKELLHEYLRFVRGVVDSEDVPLNVSREWVQSSPVITKIRQVLTGKILSWLEDLAKNEPRKYLQFYKNFGSLFKMGVNADFEHRDRIIKLLRFETTLTEPDEPISLQQYVERMKTDQKAIYYLTGEHRDLLLKNPKLEYFLANEIEVLLLTDPVDVFVVPSIGEFDGKPVQSIEQAELDTGTVEKSEEALSANLSDNLIQVFKQVLGDRVEDVVVSRRLVSSPVILVAGKEGLDSQMEKMMKLLDRDFKGSKKVLEINPTHPLIKNLARLALGDGQNSLLRSCILQLYEGAQLLEGNLESPAEFVQRMTEIMQEATK